ncbi:MAG TPA: hypothetical protein VK988_21245 [Acidimicrobiales bacterium]|nr:hypothetical protein [Acidimicrobiales bacterium]
MPSKEVATESPSKLDFSRTVGPPRDEELSEAPLGRLAGDKPAYDTAMGAKPSMGSGRKGKKSKAGDSQGFSGSQR